MKRSLLIPRRQLLIAGASLLAAPAIARAGSMSLLGVGSPPSGGGGFTPASLPGLIVWLDATTGVAQTAGIVTQWTDRASAIAFTPVAPTFGPTYSATGFNSSFPGLSGTNGVQTGIESGASAVSFGASNNTGTFAVVANIPSSAPNIRTLLAFLATGGSNEDSDPNSVDIRYLSAPTMQVVQQSAGLTNDSFSNGANIRFLWEFDGTNETSYFNNVQQSQVSSNFNFGASGTGNGGLCIFSKNGDSSNFLTSTVAEVVVTKSALSSANRIALDNYFKAKWGL